MPPQRRHFGCDLRLNITPGRELSRDARVFIIASESAGKKPAEIARDLGVPDATVRSILRHYQKTGLVEPSPRTGRPEVLSDANKRAILRIVQKNPKIQYNRLIEEASVSITKGTLSLFLKEQGIQNWAPKRRKTPYAIGEKNGHGNLENTTIASSESPLAAVVATDEPRIAAPARPGGAITEDPAATERTTTADYTEMPVAAAVDTGNTVGCQERKVKLGLSRD